MFCPKNGLRYAPKQFQTVLSHLSHGSKTDTIENYVKPYEFWAFGGPKHVQRFGVPCLASLL